jgi:hypothetical protein
MYDVMRLKIRINPGVRLLRQDEGRLPLRIHGLASCQKNGNETAQQKF